MIKSINGNLLKSRGIIVQGCNAQGQMGAGVAKQIRAQWPEVYEQYRARFESHGLEVGSIDYLFVDNNERVIVNAITQEFYGNDGKIYVAYDGVKLAFEEINELVHSEEYAKSGLPMTVNFPLIGCGLAGGDWNIVSGIINEALDDDVEKVLWIYG